ncbi:MAG TPA: OmpA family protein [Tepidisphaeraceae bacterium]|nr:OmpA family protein [Tepidisphaeraceae bacterium]
MAKKEPCKCEEAECECPEWIFTFADLVMLMMGFFVILWVLKPAPGKDGANLDDPELVKVLASVRDAFNFLPDSQNPDKVDLYRLMKKLEQAPTLRGKGDGGQTRRQRTGAEGDQPEVLSVRHGEQAIIGSRVMFAAGSDALDSQANTILDQIALLIKGHRNVMWVKGHTSVDDLPETASAQQKLDLSIRRAKHVADYLIARGVEPDILRVLGCSTFEPVAQRAYTPEARQMNRRVEVEATTLLVAELQDRVETAPPTSNPTRPAKAVP